MRAPARDSWAALRAIWALLRRDLRVWTYFRFNFMVAQIDSLVEVLILFMIIRFKPGDEMLASFGNNYVAFVITGMAVNALLGTALSAPYSSLMGAFWSNRLEVLLLSPISLPMFIFGTSLGSYVKAVLPVAQYLLVGLMFFGLTFAPNAPHAQAVGVAALGMLACAGLGLAAASMAYFLDARGGSDPVQFFVTLIAGFACGVYFPVQVMPRWVQWTACLVPHTYALDGARRLLLGGSAQQPSLLIHTTIPLEPVATDVALLLVQVCLWLPVGWFLFEKGIARARIDGRMSRWV
ncbi:MAG: ABC transporter permease [Armatimonadota bacterium]